MLNKLYSLFKTNMPEGNEVSGWRLVKNKVRKIANMSPD
jgi:hypothetical protein